MKICIARLRSGANYMKPLDHIMDSFYELLKQYVEKHPEHEFTYYNFGFNRKPVRDVAAIEAADVILIPSEAEFTYWIPGAIHTLDLKKSNALLDEVRPYFNYKKVIILRSDRRDDIELYQTKVFPNQMISYDVIDEIDFGNIHGMKYHFVKNNNTLYVDNEKIHDFVYWGSDKRKTVDGQPSGDIRHKILKEIHKDENIHSYFIGRFYGFKRDRQWSKMIDIIPIIQKSYSTLCFNWMDNTATTSRYVEAVACGCYPFVWQEYDIHNTFVASEWQRVYSFEEYREKLSYITQSGNFETQFKKVEDKLLQVLKSPSEYYTMFESMLESKIAHAEMVL